MKSIILLLFFAGAFLVVHSIYEQKLQEERNNKKVVYKFVPRSMLDDQFDDSHVSKRFNGMFAPVDMGTDKPYTLTQ